MGRSTRQEVQRRIKGMVTQIDQFEMNLEVILNLGQGRSAVIEEYALILFQGSEALRVLTNDLYSKF